MPVSNEVKYHEIKEILSGTMPKKEWPRTSFQTLDVKKITGGVSDIHI